METLRMAALFLFDGEHAVPLSWSSHKLKRVARSTLCAETLAAVEALDNAYLLSAIVGELINKERLQIDLYTDKIIKAILTLYPLQMLCWISV